ncbi:hypothetical protein [Aquihabitans sp. McL0605]|uniref:hypothetical protein n=1 Tax=Aquihabitans sp. McL0605 TaxID=3415671 RepID=UPI003CF77748
MDHALGFTLKWIGRILILAAVFVLVSSLFLPDAVQPLNSTLCPAGTKLDNGRYAQPGSPDNAKLELVCTGAEHTEVVAHKLLLFVIGLIAVGLASIYLGQRIVRPQFHRPVTPSLH